MLRLIEVPDVSFCGCSIFLGAKLDNLSTPAMEDAAKIFKDAYGNCILDSSKITQHPAKKKSRLKRRRKEDDVV